jgi:hypothetical protein
MNQNNASSRGSLSREWRRLTQLSTGVISFVAGFLIPPPIGLEKWSFVGLAEFMLLVSLGLLVVLITRWRLRKHLQRWVWLTVVSFAVAIGAFFLYRYLVLSWTCSYFGTQVVVGTQLTPAGTSYLAQHPNVDCSTMVGDFAGKVENAWVNGTIVRRQLFLAGLYASCMPLLGASIIGVLQAIVIAKPPGKAH